MKDSVYYLISAVLFVLLAMVFITIGYQIGVKQRMDLIIAYHSDKVSEKDKAAYCRWMGVGVSIIGIGLFLSGSAVIFSHSALMFIPLVCGLIMGGCLLVWTIGRYNR